MIADSYRSRPAVEAHLLRASKLIRARPDWTEHVLADLVEGGWLDGVVEAMRWAALLHQCSDRNAAGQRMD